MNRPPLLRALAAMLGAAGLASAAQAAGGALSIVRAWSLATPPSAPTAVGYLTIVNPSDRPDRLVSLSSPAAASVQVHSMSMAGGIMRMRPVEGGLEIPAHGRAVLSPQGDHLMFMGLKRPFKAGARIPVTLVFQHAPAAHADLQVQAPGAPAPAMPRMDMTRH